MSLNLFSYADSDSSEEKESSSSPRELYLFDNLVILREITTDSTNKEDNISTVESISKGTETQTSKRMHLHSYL